MWDQSLSCRLIRKRPKAQQTQSVEGNIPSLFAVKFTAHHIETLFSPAAYQRISKRLFPSLVAPTRTDGSCLPSIATSAHSNTGVSLHHPSPPLKSVQQQKTDHKWVAPRYRRQSTSVKQSPRDYRQAKHLSPSHPLFFIPLTWLTLLGQQAVGTPLGSHLFQTDHSSTQRPAQQWVAYLTLPPS